MKLKHEKAYWLMVALTSLLLAGLEWHRHGIVSALGWFVSALTVLDMFITKKLDG